MRASSFSEVRKLFYSHGWKEIKADATGSTYYKKHRKGWVYFQSPSGKIQPMLRSSAYDLDLLESKLRNFNPSIKNMGKFGRQAKGGSWEYLGGTIDWDEWRNPPWKFYKGGKSFKFNPQPNNITEAKAIIKKALQPKKNPAPKNWMKCKAVRIIGNRLEVRK